MVALPPIATSFPGAARPATTAPVNGAGEAVRLTQEAQAAAAEANARTRQTQEQARSAAAQAAERLQGDPENRPKPQLPEPRFARNVGLFDDSFRVFVDIVLSNDASNRVARVYGTPPAQKVDGPNRSTGAPVNISA